MATAEGVLERVVQHRRAWSAASRPAGSRLPPARNLPRASSTVPQRERRSTGRGTTREAVNEWTRLGREITQRWLVDGHRDAHGQLTPNFVDPAALCRPRMVDEARARGADAVLAVDLDYEVVGKEGSMLMVSASGTAVRLG